MIIAIEQIPRCVLVMVRHSSSLFSEPPQKYFMFECPIIFLLDEVTVATIIKISIESMLNIMV